MTKKPTGKQVSELSGELVTAPVEIPFAPGFDLEALKLVDEEPVFATVKIQSGRGDQGRGPKYGPDLLKNIAEQINQKRPPGYRGHQNPENVEFEWREPVTAWVGATCAHRGGGEADLYVKGYIPPTAGELRTQLKLAASGADIVNSVSIFGIRDVEGDEVTKFDLWSLDWTPRGRAGMNTELVAVSGEQHKEDEMDRDQIIAALKAGDIPDHVSGEIRKDEREKVVEELRPQTEAVGEMRIILELDSGADSEAIVTALRALVGSNVDTEVEAKVDKAIEAEITSPLVRSAVKNLVLPKIETKTTDEELKGEIENALKVPYIAALKDGALPVVQGGGKPDEAGKLVGAHWA